MPMCQQFHPLYFAVVSTGLAALPFGEMWEVNMKRRLPVTLMILFAVAPLGLAQQTASDSPASKEDIQKYLDLVHSKEMMSKTMDAMAKPMRQMFHEQYLRDKEKLPPDFEERLSKLMDEYFRSMPFDEMLQAMVPVYQKHFTKGDVDALLAFYSSPIGQKMIRELPAITAEAMEAMVPILREKMDVMSQRMQQEVAQMMKDYKPGGKPAATRN